MASHRGGRPVRSGRDAGDVKAAVNKEAMFDESAQLALKTYVYKGDDQSVLYKLVLGPLAQHLVDTRTPLWLAEVPACSAARSADMRTPVRGMSHHQDAAALTFYPPPRLQPQCHHSHGTMPAGPCLRCRPVLLP